MSRLNKLFVVLTVLILLSVAAQAVNAQAVIVGPNNDLSRYPIGLDPASATSAFPDFAAGGIYQQVYAASAFSGPITITKIAFASSSSLTSGSGIATYNFNLGLSTTAVGPNSLTTNFAANRGADFAQVFSGLLTATITRSDQFDLIIDITPFTYDPANGNLLLDVTMNSPTLFSGGSTLYYRAGNSSDISRAANPANNPGGAFVTQGFGLQTRFTAQSNTAPDAIDDAAIINEDSGANSINVLANDTDHENDALTITAITQGLHGAVAISGGGAGLTYTPPADYFGPDTFTYTISDGHGGSDTASVNVTVNAVNDAPSFTKGADQIVNEDAGAQTVNAWATNIIAGPANESGQTVNFSVTNDRNDLFATQPSINASGLLTYNSAPNVFGVATVTVALHDDGGTANGGHDSSGTQRFTITINPVADFPSVTNATTSVNTQTNSGLVIDRNPVDGPEVTHFKITSITNGRLFQHDGTTQIVNGGVITLAQGQAGLKFTPDANLFSPASSFFFTVQAGIGNSDESFSSAFVTASIGVGCPSANLVVTNSNDSGAGSLREALTTACPGSTITFDMSPGHVISPITLTGGEVLIDREVTITGPASTNLNVTGNDSSRIFDISSGNRVAISNLTITGGKADSGAAIRSQGNLIIGNSTFTGNHTTGEGSGGALDIAGGSLFMTNSTISGNAAEGDGGGLHNQSALATLINVTITNNRADSNSDGSGNGGGIFQASSQLNLRNSLVAGNFKGNGASASDVAVSQVAEPFASISSNNLIGLDDGSSGLLPNINLLGSVANPIDALLGPLADNGGATATHLLLPGSPAIKTGINTLEGGNQAVLERDQRGFDRVVAGPIDIGAVEVSYAISAGSGTPQSAVIGNVFALPFQATVTESGSGRPGIPVTFTAPTSGASGSFSAGATVLTNVEGLAIAPPFTANLIAGPYNVTAGLGGGSPSVAFALTNTIGTAQVTLGNLVQTFDGVPKSVSVSSDPVGLNVVITYDGSANAPTNAGNYAVRAIVNDANFNGQADAVLAIQPASQLITFDALADKKFGVGDFNVSATASSGLTVTFTAVGNCTVTGTQVHLTGAGACTISAKQDGNSNVNATSVARTFSISKADQQITFAALPDQKFDDPDFNVAATASSNLEVSFAASGNCTLTGAQVHLGGAGACTITATQEGNSDYHPATAIARTFTIGKADQQITFDALADKKFGDADSEVTASASSHLVVTFAATGNCAFIGSRVHLNGAGACTITASQNGNENINAATPVVRTFSIGKSGQQITFAALPDKTFGDADIALDATASSNLAVSFAALGKCSLTGNQVHLTGAGICTITTSQNGNSDYDAATNVTRTFAIGKADQQITFGALADRTAGDADFNISAAASSDLTVVFAAVGSCTLSGTQIHLTGAGSCTVTASQDGNADYNPAADVLRTFTIAEQPNNQPVFSFGSAAYEVSEGVGSVRIEVKRGGDTSAATTVDYSTDDTGASLDCGNFNGFASSRCDFNTALGTLKFSPGETLKTFDVLINRDSYIEAPFETFTVKLSNPTGGATLGMPATAMVKIDDQNDGSPDALANIIDRTPAFVRQQYHDFLNREPDQAGLAFWVDNIDQCDDPARRPADQTVSQCKEVMRINTSAAFFLSIEWSQTGGLVRAFYTLALDRPHNLPAFPEFIRDAQEVGRGVIVGEGDWQRQLNDNREAFMKDFVTRPEFVARYPTVDSPATYVDKLYLHAFGRTATAAELADASGEFGGSATAADPSARAHALLRLTVAPDFAGETNNAFVQMQYLGYLRRNANDSPDSNFDGFDFWVTKLNRSKGDFLNAEMVKAFLESREYRARFGP